MTIPTQNQIVINHARHKNLQIKDPAVVDNKLYIRTAKSLYAFGE